MQQMLSPFHLRARLRGHLSLAAAAFLGSSLAFAASAQNLPATPPTAQTPSQTAPINATIPNGHPAVPAHRAEVTYADGMLSVRTNNSSLHQVLRAISRATGMTITGGIADDRVFGDYGPAAPATVLATLLDGTGTNVLLRDGDATRPMELILTPRTGGPTQPMAATPISMDADDTPPAPAQSIPGQPYTSPANGTILPGEDARSAARRLGPASPFNNQNAPQNQNTQSTPQPMPQPLNNVNGSPSNTTPTASQAPTTNSVPLDSVPTPSTTPDAAQGIVDSPNPPAPGSTTGSGAKTPEQIYQQLLQMQQKQQQNPPAQPTTPSTTPPGGPSN